MTNPIKQACAYLAVGQSYPRVIRAEFDSLSDANEYAALHGHRVVVRFADGTTQPL